jgi:hypothetical protein
MTTMTPGGTASGAGARGEAGAALPPGSVPFTTATAGSVAIPKIPEYVGDSWRPTAAGLLGALPLAVVSAALVGTAMAGSALVPAPHSAALPPGSVPFTTATAWSMTDPKIPEAVGD